MLIASLLKRVISKSKTKRAKSNATQLSKNSTWARHSIWRKQRLGSPMRTNSWPRQPWASARRRSRLNAAKVTEEKIHSLQVDLPAEVTFPAFPGETFQGNVFKIDPNIDPVTRTFTVYIQIENRPYIRAAYEVPLTLHAEDYRLKPGLSGFAHIRRTAKDVTAIPSVAIMSPSGDQASVFVVDRSGRATPRKVNLGIVANGMTEVTSGLNEAEKVVTVGQLYLKENDKVQSTSKSIFGK